MHFQKLVIYKVNHNGLFHNAKQGCCKRKAVAAGGITVMTAFKVLIGIFFRDLKCKVPEIVWKCWEKCKEPKSHHCCPVATSCSKKRISKNTHWQKNNMLNY